MGRGGPKAAAFKATSLSPSRKAMNHIDITRRGQCLCARLAGDFADNAARDIDAALLGVAEAPTLVLDLSDAASLGGAGIAYLIRLQTRLSTRGGTLFLHALSDAVAQELAIRDLTDFFRVVEEWDEDMGEEMLPLLAVR